MNDIVMLGPQGSGKGTQASAMSESLSMPHISLGTLFRAEVQAGTDVGKEISGYITRGDIVPSATANAVISGRLSKPETWPAPWRNWKKLRTSTTMPTV